MKLEKLNGDEGAGGATGESSKTPSAEAGEAEKEVPYGCKREGRRITLVDVVKGPFEPQGSGYKGELSAPISWLLLLTMLILSLSSHLAGGPIVETHSVSLV